MGEISDKELHDVVEGVMLEEIQTLRVGLEDWKKVAQDWATENLATAKKLVEAEVEVERLRAEVAVQQAKIANMRLECVRVEAARDEAVREAIWRIENETRAAGERDKARAEVARLRGLVERACQPLIVAAEAWARHHERLRDAGADYHGTEQDLLEAVHGLRLARLVAELEEPITNPITNPAPIEHGLVMDECEEPFAEGDAEQRPSQTCACSSAYREIGPGIHAKYCALAGQLLDDGRQRWQCAACAAVSTVDRCPQCGGVSVQEGRS